MDDIAFFESSEHQHRGGIWADASRKERTVSEMLNGVPSGSEGTAAAATGPGPNMQKSKSTENVTTELTNGIPEPEIVSRAATVGGAEESDSSKRKSWFTSTRSTGLPSLNVEGVEVADVDDAQKPVASDMERGRSTDSSSSETGASGRRATSVPASSPSAPAFDASDRADNDPSHASSSAVQDGVDGGQDDLSLNPPSPRVRSLSSGANLGTPDTPSSASSDRTSFLRDALSRTSTTMNSSSASNTSSLFSALKSRADKQTLNNAAKEAMRKWSANWKGFKAEHGGGGSSSSADEAADTGGVQAEGSSSTPSLFSFPTKRPNYADIRAAVTGRKEAKDRERVVSTEREPGEPSLPIDILSEDKNIDRSRTHSASSSLSANDFNPSASSPPQSQPQTPRGPSLLRQEPGRAVPSPPKITTQTSQTATSEALDEATPIHAPPIKTQPSTGATMTIPGIHVSHRNDVMSMGYAPPTPPAPATPDSKLRAPAIQSMYRLFKPPTNGGSGQHEPSTPTGPRNSTDEDRDEPTPSQSSSSAAPTPPPVMGSVSPPPLPPRKTSAAASTSPSPNRAISPAPGSGSADGEFTSSLTTPKASTSPPGSASDALKQIAEQDSSIRRSLEGPEQRRGSVSKKRNSLGAKRIAPLRADPFLDQEDDGMPNGEASTAQEYTETQPDNRPTESASPRHVPDAVPSSTNAGDHHPPDVPDKPQPPPLPPRRLSTSVTPA